MGMLATTLVVWLFVAQAAVVSHALSITSCAGVPDGTYADANACNKYYVCFAGTTSHFTCPASLWFNLNTGNCDYSYNVNCAAAATTIAAPLTAGQTSAPVALTTTTITTATTATSGISTTTKDTLSVSCSDDSECSSSQSCVNNECIDCGSGYIGEHCVAFHCAASEGACQQGFECNETSGMCMCEDGFTGYNCADFDCSAASGSCLNGGTCFDVVAHVSACTCPPGYTGVNCATFNCTLDDASCSSNGACDTQTGVCSCGSGYNPPSCKSSVCDSRPCINGETCTVIGGYPKCECIEGYTGAFCQTFECRTNADCLHGGKCPVVGTACVCASGYLTENCAEFNCLTASPISPPCVNGGTCEVDGACRCLPGYVGAKCEIEVDECASNPCQNDASCVDGVNGYLCFPCPITYTGVNCEILIDHCASNPCHNGGTCVNNDSGYTCNCFGGYAATDNCQTFFCNDNAHCLNSGNCTFLNVNPRIPVGSCQCAKGYGGTNCAKFNCLTASPLPDTTEVCQNNGRCDRYEGNIDYDNDDLGTCACTASRTGNYCETVKHPNIILIVADDLGYADVGFSEFASPDIRTPHMDSLISNYGLSLQNYYVQGCCTPSRQQLLFGIHEIRTGLNHEVIHSGQRNGVDVPIVGGQPLPSLPEILKQKGYATHIAGKWHLGHFNQSYLPTARGFDSYLGLLNGAGDHYTHVGSETFQDVSGNSWMFTGHDFLDDGKQSFVNDGEYSTHVFTNRFEQKLAEHMLNIDLKTKPFFFEVAFSAPHFPLQPPPGYTGSDDPRAVYAAMVEDIDKAVERIYQALVKHNLWENSIIIFTTDNGGDAEHQGNSFPLRGKKLTLWQGAIRGPAFVASPLLINSQRATSTRNHAMIHISDFYLTLGELVGYNFDTSGFRPLLNGKNVWDILQYNLQESERTQLLINIDDHDKSKTPYVHSWTNNDEKCTLYASGLIKKIDGKYYKLLAGYPGAGLYYDVINGTKTSLNEDPNKNLWLFDISADPYERYDLLEEAPTSEIKDIASNMLDDICEQLHEAFIGTKYPPMDLWANPSFQQNSFMPWVNNKFPPQVSRLGG